ncbi:MAG TPA: class I SAM-dependent methyltransferase [Candidatus Angelobacter sp.]|nr:class I SAM-dependent methyltransferase [Candidatus Angelobacter sp.]
MSFDVLAPHYRWMEFVLAGEKLQRCRTAFLNQVRGSKNVLVLGEGNGRFLSECRRNLPNATITCVDASAGMLHQARQRLAARGMDDSRIDFIHANALAWMPPQQAFDLIVTHFFLDCFRRDQLESLIAGLARAALPGANWLLADFQAANTGLARFRSRLILWTMYRFFTIVTRLPAGALTPPDALLLQHGFHLRERAVREWGLLHTDWWQS